MATRMVTSAALAWLIDSIVCGMTPSSAATTSTAMSVTLAPRARMAVNASCPGVSRKVMFASPPSDPTTSTEYAPMCWVMPPASPSATCALRMASSNDVLPWSTWPMMVTTGGRATSSSGLSSVSGMNSSISKPTFSTFQP